MGQASLHDARLIMQNVVQAENAVLMAAAQLGGTAPAELVRMADRIRSDRARDAESPATVARAQ